eukprot:3156313-Rhodomonas_salina.1
MMVFKLRSPSASEYRTLVVYWHSGRAQQQDSASNTQLCTQWSLVFFRVPDEGKSSVRAEGCRLRLSGFEVRGPGVRCA